MLVRLLLYVAFSRTVSYVQQDTTASMTTYILVQLGSIKLQRKVPHAAQLVPDVGAPSQPRPHVPTVVPPVNTRPEAPRTAVVVLSMQCAGARSERLPPVRTAVPPVNTRPEAPRTDVQLSMQDAGALLVEPLLVPPVVPPVSTRPEAPRTAAVVLSMQGVGARSERLPPVPTVAP